MAANCGECLMARVEMVPLSADGSCPKCGAYKPAPSLPDQLRRIAAEGRCIRSQVPIFRRAAQALEDQAGLHSKAVEAANAQAEIMQRMVVLRDGLYSAIQAKDEAIRHALATLDGSGHACVAMLRDALKGGS